MKLWWKSLENHEIYGKSSEHQTSDGGLAESFLLINELDKIKNMLFLINMVQTSELGLDWEIVEAVEFLHENSDKQ